MSPVYLLTYGRAVLHVSELSQINCIIGIKNVINCVICVVVIFVLYFEFIFAPIGLSCDGYVGTKIYAVGFLFSLIALLSIFALIVVVLIPYLMLICTLNSRGQNK